MFRRFCLPALERLSRRYGGICVHCCANSEPQWDNFTHIPGLRLINLNQPDPVLWRAYRYFAHVAAQMHTRGIDPSSPEDYRAARLLPEAHVVLFAPASSADEAKRVYEGLVSVRE